MIPLDFVSILILMGVAAIVIFRRKQFVKMTLLYPYPMGAIKFAVLATLGSQLKLRIMAGDYVPEILLGQAVAWAAIGLLITWAFRIFNIWAEKIAPQWMGWKLALLKSFLINSIFAYPMMLLHTILEALLVEQAMPALTRAIWGPTGFIVQTIAFFWLPAHWFTFSRKREWQILIAALLSIMLGIFLAFTS